MCSVVESVRNKLTTENQIMLCSEPTSKQIVYSSNNESNLEKFFFNNILLDLIDSKNKNIYVLGEDIEVRKIWWKIYELVYEYFNSELFYNILHLSGDDYMEISVTDRNLKNPNRNIINYVKIWFNKITVLVEIDKYHLMNPTEELLSSFSQCNYVATIKVEDNG